MWASVVAARGLRGCGLIVPRHVESSQTRDRTRVPCIGRWILNHCITWEVLPKTSLGGMLGQHGQRQEPCCATIHGTAATPNLHGSARQGRDWRVRLGRPCGCSGMSLLWEFGGGQ